MKILGLTGNIGSGKSVVAELFQLLGIPVYDSDAHSKTLCNTDDALKAGLIQLFGADIYTDGLLNRQIMARRIFSNPEALKSANALIHPAVKKDFRKWAENRNFLPAVALETAILFEAGLEKYIDQIICVTAPEELRIERVCKRSNLNPEDIRARIKNQLSEDELIRRSNVVFVNDGVHALIPQVNEFIKTLSDSKEKVLKLFL